MKKILLIFLLLACVGNFAQKAIAQAWTAVGANDFDELSYNLASSTSIAMNGTVPYVAFVDGTTQKANVKKLKAAGSGWESVGPADFSADAARWLKLAISGSTPYVVYQDVASGERAVVMKLNSAGTAWEIVGNSPVSDAYASYTTIAFNGNTPYVAYRDGANDQKATVKRLNSAGTGWETVGTPGFSEGEVRFTSIAINAGVPYVVYSSNAVCTVKKLNSAGTAWETVGPAEFSGLGADGSSIISYNGTPYVAYQDQEKVTVKKLNAAGTDWETVGTERFSIGEAAHISMSFNGSSFYVAYMDFGLFGRATVVKLNASGTAWEPVGNSGFSVDFAQTVGIAAGSGTPYVVYVDEGWGSKAVVKKLNSKGTLWESVAQKTISEGDGFSPSMALDNNNVPYIVYAARVNGSRATVKKLNAAGSDWESVGLEGFSAAAASSTTISFKESVPYVAYQDEAKGFRATVKRFNAASNLWESVGQEGFSGANANYLSIVVNKGIPYVVYSDEANEGRVIVKRFNPSGKWQNVGAPGFSPGRVYYPSLAFVGSRPYVAFSDDNQKVTVMRLSTSGMVWETVADADFVGKQFTRPILGVSGSTVYVVCRENLSGAGFLKRLNAEGTAWVNVGGGAFFDYVQPEDYSLAFSGTTPYISFSDHTQGSKASVVRLSSAGTWETVGASGFSAGQILAPSIVATTSTVYIAYSNGSLFAKKMTVKATSVNLKGFSVKVQGRGVKLEWITEWEKNNSYFTICRSSDGQNFSTIATLKAKGTSSTPTKYAAFDDNPSAGLNYYKLSQTDKKGVTTELGLRTIQVDLKPGACLKAFPNPARSKVAIQLDAGLYSKAELFSMGGRPLQSKDIRQDDSLVEFNVESLPVGLYFVYLNGKKGKAACQFVKQ